MPYSAQTCDITAPSSLAATTKRIRSSMTQVSFHGIGRTSCRALKTCQPCIRSILSAIYPVRTLSQPLPLAGLGDLHMFEDGGGGSEGSQPVMEGYRSGRFGLVFMPSAEFGDDPCRPGEGVWGMGVFLACGVALHLLIEDGDQLDLMLV